MHFICLGIFLICEEGEQIMSATQNGTRSERDRVASERANCELRIANCNERNANARVRAIIIATKFSFSRSRPDAQLHSKICTQLGTYINI